jgi:hypothetical protein
MKKSLFMIVLVFAMVAFAAAQAAPAPSAPQSAPPSSSAGAPGASGSPGASTGAQTGATGQADSMGQTGTAGQPGAGQTGATGAAQPPQQKKEIKNPAEYQAYISAIQTQDPSAKAQALEAFLQTYPQSVVKEDALEALMAAYQQSQNVPKLQDAAQRLLQVNPNHVPALTLLAVTNRTACEQQMAQAPTANALPPACAQARQFAERGIQALPNWSPEGIAPDALQKQKQQLTPLLNGTAGFTALQAKDYASAIRYLRPLAEQPNATVADIYPLAVAYLEQKPPDPQGLYYIARAAALSQGTPAQAQISRYGSAKYAKYHGSQEGWDQLVAEAKSSPTPPPGFQVKPAPSPAEQAATLVQQKPVAQMSFDEFELVFTSGNQQAIDKVWNEIKGKPIAFEAKVVQSSPKQLTMAATAEDIEKNPPQADVTVAMGTAAAKPPAQGTMAQVQGVPVSYTPNPFMITMDNGRLIGKSAAGAGKATTKSTTTTHKKTTTRKK